MKEWPLDKPFLLTLLMSKTTKTCAYFAPSLVLHSLALLWLPFIAEKRPMAHKGLPQDQCFSNLFKFWISWLGLGLKILHFQQAHRCCCCCWSIGLTLSGKEKVPKELSRDVICLSQKDLKEERKRVLLLQSKLILKLMKIPVGKNSGVLYNLTHIAWGMLWLSKNLHEIHRKTDIPWPDLKNSL